jgi:hypothetical protein
MREDFKFPYRVITRQEEIEGNKALGFIIGLILFAPIVLVHKILSAIIPGTVLVFVYLFLIVMGISYFIFSL